MATNKLVGRIQKRLIAITVCVAGALLLVQVLILGTVGTSGPEISRVRAERERTQLANEIAQAKIRELQTQGAIWGSANDELGMQEHIAERLIASDKNDTATQPVASKF